MLTDIFILLLILSPTPFEGRYINLTDLKKLPIHEKVLQNNNPQVSAKFPSHGKIPQNNLQISSNWSFIAVIVYGRRVLCAGTAFNEKWLLTLAHCVHGTSKDLNLARFGSMSVRLGAAPMGYKKIKEIEIKTGKRHGDEEYYVPVVDPTNLLPVYKVVVHPEYSYKENPKNTRLPFVGNKKFSSSSTQIKIDTF